MDAYNKVAARAQSSQKKVPTASHYFFYPTQIASQFHAHEERCGKIGQGGPCVPFVDGVCTFGTVKKHACLLDAFLSKKRAPRSGGHFWFPDLGPLTVYEHIVVPLLGSKNGPQKWGPNSVGNLARLMRKFASRDASRTNALVQNLTSSEGHSHTGSKSS